MSAQLPRARFGVRTLFVAIAGWAVTLGFVRDSGTPLATGFVLFIVYALVIATVGAIWAAKRWAHMYAGFTLCAGAFFYLFPPKEYVVSTYLPRFGCSDTVKEKIVSWLPLRKPKVISFPAYLLPPPVGPTDPADLFPRTTAPCLRTKLVESPDLPTDPLSVAARVFGLGSPPRDPFVCTGCGGSPSPPPATAIEHCLTTLLVGICGAATVCWFQKPQHRG
jgi:hypothetical protein